MDIEIIEQQATLVTTPEEINLGLKRIEQMGRICWQSETLTDDPIPFIQRLIGKHHESVLEHFSFSFIFITNRAVSHQLVRHRMASFSQESQRYCCYSKDKFDNKIVFIKPVDDIYYKFNRYMWDAAYAYEYLADDYKPEVARLVLPNAVKTQIGMTANLREWRHIFKERMSNAADPQIRDLMWKAYNALPENLQQLFIDVLPK